MKILKKIISLILVCVCVLSLSACGKQPCVHNYTGLTTREATCKETGIKKYTCTECGKSYTEDIAKLTTHSYTSAVTKEATCKEMGVRTYTCAVCGDLYTEDIAKANNHKGAYQCVDCGKNFYNDFSNHILDKGEYSASADALIRFYYFEEGESCEILIHKYSHKISFSTSKGLGRSVGLYFYPTNTQYSVYILPSGEQIINPQTITKTWEGLSINNVDKQIIAKGIKRILNAIEYYLYQEGLGYNISNLGFTNF